MGNLPVIIIPAICHEKGSPFGAADVCHTYGMVYASLSMAVCIEYSIPSTSHSNSQILTYTHSIFHFTTIPSGWIDLLVDMCLQHCTRFLKQQQE